MWNAGRMKEGANNQNAYSKGDKNKMYKLHMNVLSDAVARQQKQNERRP
jgi:hypothetical protein